MTEKRITPFSRYRAPEPPPLPQEFLDRVSNQEDLPSAKQEALGVFAEIWKQLGVPETDVLKNSNIISEAGPRQVAHTLYAASLLKPRTA